MSMKYCCDICEKQLTSNRFRLDFSFGSESNEITYTGDHYHYNLCPECRDKLIQMLFGKCDEKE